MFKDLYLNRVAAALLGIAAVCIQPAHAALGGGAASVDEDAAAVAGTHSVSPRQGYDLHVIAAAAGTRIAEFIDSDGRVFAVTWTGPVMPDLRALLGTHYAAFAAALAAQSPRPPHAALRVATPGLVVETGGHMRAVSGRAYLPGGLPADMAVSDVR